MCIRVSQVEERTICNPINPQLIPFPGEGLKKEKKKKSKKSYLFTYLAVLGLS